MTRVQPFEQADHGFGRAVIEVSGRLVSQQQAWLRDQCPRKRNALLFPAGKFSGKMVRSCLQTYLAQKLSCFGKCFRSGFVTRQQRHGSILQGRKFRQQVVQLPNIANLAIAKSSRLSR